MPSNHDAPSVFDAAVRSTNHAFVRSEMAPGCDLLMSDGKRCDRPMMAHVQPEAEVPLQMTLAADLVIYVTEDQQNRISNLTDKQYRALVDIMRKSTETYTDLGWPRHQFRARLRGDSDLCYHEIDRKFAPTNTHLYTDTPCGHVADHPIHIA